MMMRIRGEPLLLLALVASLLGLCSAFLLPSPAPSSSLSPRVGGASSSQIGGRRAAAFPVLGPKKDDSDAELSAEFARRLEEEDDENAPAPLKGRSRPPPPPQGVGTPQKGQRSLLTMPKTNSVNRELGTDYWMDEKDVKKEQQKKVKRKAPSPDQFPKERIRDEIVSPYKNNWILFIAITIFSIAFFAYLFPEELQIPSIQIPDFETGPAIPESLN